jgi:hypothetical protein
VGTFERHWKAALEAARKDPNFERRVEKQAEEEKTRGSEGPSRSQ